jgi:putrescine transport system substrate-binding protein
MRLQFSSITRAAGVIVFSLLVAAVAAQASTDNTVNVYNWSNYIAPDVIAKFTKETGIKVNYDTYDGVETPLVKMLAGNSGYDVVILNASTAGLAVQANLLAKFDSKNIPNLKYLDPKLQKLIAPADPKNDQIAIYLWSYAAIGINKQAVQKALGTLPIPENPWSLIFDPKYASKISKCGLSVLNNATDNAKHALEYLNLPPDSKNPADYKSALTLMNSIKPYIRDISSDGYIDNLISGNICVAMGYSGDINLAESRSATAKRPYKIEALSSNKNIEMIMDGMVIPKDAPHVSNAEKFINFILEPKISASLTNKLYSNNPNIDAKAFIKKDILNNPAIFLPPEKMKILTPVNTLRNRDVDRLRTRFFADFQSGLTW